MKIMLANMIRYQAPKILKNNVVKSAFSWIHRNPKISIPIGGFIGSGIINSYLKRTAEKERYSPVYQKLVSGSKPSIPFHFDSEKIIPRPDVADAIKAKYFPNVQNETKTRFGVIIGPSGSGKTYMIRDLCNKSPEGVLYLEITQPDTFVHKLSEEIGMKTAPTTMFDLIYGFIYEKYTHYFVLPESQLLGIDMVIRVLEKAATKYTAEHHGKVPVLFLDGVDLLARHDKKLCDQLITLSKIMANNNTLKIVLVSSEGYIIPILKENSSKNRACLHEIDDVDEEKAVTYLMKNGISKDTAEKCFKCVGGRIIHLENYVQFMKTIALKSGENLCEKIKLEMFSLDLTKQKEIISVMHPESVEILTELSKNENVSITALMKNTKDKERMCDAITKMVKENVLRYTLEGLITWHSKVQRDEFWMDGYC